MNKKEHHSFKTKNKQKLREIKLEKLAMRLKLNLKKRKINKISK